MSIEIRHLRYFLAVADELHFGRAARRVGIAQPALSQQIRKLEAEIGAELFHRTKREVMLSAAGQALLRHARHALEDVVAGTEAARRAARGEIGSLTVGFVETAASTIVPRAVRRFRDERPDVGLTLRELSVDAQVEGLRSGALDIGIVRPPVDANELRFERVLDEPLVVAVPDGHRLAVRRRIAPRALAEEPLVLLARSSVPGLYDQVIGLCEEHSGAARIAQEASSIQAVLGLVAAGLGVSVLPASVRSLDRTGVAFIGLSPSPTSSMLVSSRRGDRSPLIPAFLVAARQAARA
jgi:LysR family transcriptional regulator, benzoate and cis,cis-muconate-responsive activator of ben and cat genes